MGWQQPRAIRAYKQHAILLCPTFVPPPDTRPLPPLSRGEWLPDGCMPLGGARVAGGWAGWGAAEGGAGVGDDQKPFCSGSHAAARRSPPDRRPPRPPVARIQRTGPPWGPSASRRAAAGGRTNARPRVPRRWCVVGCVSCAPHTLAASCPPLPPSHTTALAPHVMRPARRPPVGGWGGRGRGGVVGVFGSKKCFLPPPSPPPADAHRALPHTLSPHHKNTRIAWRPLRARPALPTSVFCTHGDRALAARRARGRAPARCLVRRAHG